MFRREHGSILAGLLRNSGGDFFAAEDALADALRLALEQWPVQGIPERPAAWIQTVARRRLIDSHRRTRPLPLADSDEESRPQEAAMLEPDLCFGGEDDRLRLLFTCCHPALDSKAQTALILHSLCGLETEQIARAYLTSTPTLAQRLVRAKRKIRDAGIPYRVPAQEQIADRMDTVLRVLYLVFNEGYSDPTAEPQERRQLVGEAVDLTRQLAAWLPDQPEVRGLLALMLLQDSRRLARVSEGGHLRLLDEQDRSLWDRDQIQECLALVEQALSQAPAGPYALQAAIAAVHSESGTPEATDWAQIEQLYDLLLRGSASPVVELNRAVAVCMNRGPAAALDELRDRVDSGALDSYLYYHSTLADLHRRLGDLPRARRCYRRALELADHPVERRFLSERLGGISDEFESELPPPT